MGTIQPLSLISMEEPISNAAHAITSTGTEEHVTVSHLSLFHSRIESTVGCRFKNVMGTYLRRKKKEKMVNCTTLVVCSILGRSGDFKCSSEEGLKRPRCRLQSWDFVLSDDRIESWVRNDI